MDSNCKDIIICIFVIITLINSYFILTRNKNIENMSNISQLNSEAIQNIASIYNSKKMVIDNLEVKGNIKVDTLDATNINATKVTTAESKIGKIWIRGDRIGTDKFGDLSLTDSGWLYMNDYNSNNINTRGGLRLGRVKCPEFGVEAKRVSFKTYGIEEDAKGNLQFIRSGISMAHFPWHEYHPFVFKATGLMYTNKEYEHLPHDYQQYRGRIHERVFNEVDARTKNPIYLGGTDATDKGLHMSIIGQRLDGGIKNLHQVKLHGHDNICRNGGCKYNDSRHPSNRMNP